MSEEQKPEEKQKSGALREWGFDTKAFEARAKKSLEARRGDLSEVTDALKDSLTSAKQVLVDLKKTSAPVAAELKGGFERAWDEIEGAVKRAHQKMKEPKPTKESDPPKE
jgi:hypothetical protein